MLLDMEDIFKDTVLTNHRMIQNIAAESAVVCFSYWLATAFTGADKTAWHYQYSVPFAIHASDLDAYYGPPAENQGLDLVTAFRSKLSNRS